MSNQAGNPIRKTSTQEMWGLVDKPRLTIMAEVCRKLELLNIAACRTNAIWAKEARVFTTEDRAMFTNNIPGPIAVFKALEEQLMDEGLWTTTEVENRIIDILKNMVAMELPSQSEIEKDAYALVSSLRADFRFCRRLLFANTTWMTQLYNQLGKDGEPYGKIQKANSFIQLISPDEGDCESERIARQMLVVLDLQQIVVAAQWWLDVLQDSEKLVAELKAISDLKAMLSNYAGPCLSDLTPAERFAIARF